MDEHKLLRATGLGVAVWSVVVVGCSSGADSPTAASTTTTAVAETELAGFPPPDSAIAEATLASLEEPVLRDWIGVAVESVGAGSSPCDPDDTLMSVETFEAAAGLADPVTGDLLLNLDAALGAAAFWCREGDVAQADAEFADAETVAAQLAARVEEMQG